MRLPLCDESVLQIYRCLEDLNLLENETDNVRLHGSNLMVDAILGTTGALHFQFRNKRLALFLRYPWLKISICTSPSPHLKDGETSVVDPR